MARAEGGPSPTGGVSRKGSSLLSGPRLQGCWFLQLHLAQLTDTDCVLTADLRLGKYNGPRLLSALPPRARSCPPGRRSTVHTPLCCLPMGPTLNQGRKQRRAGDGGPPPGVWLRGRTARGWGQPSRDPGDPRCSRHPRSICFRSLQLEALCSNRIYIFSSTFQI